MTTLHIDTLNPAEYNPRQISKHDLESLKRSLTEFGFVEPVVINKDNTIIGGHQRVKAAKELGIEQVPVIQLDLDKDKEKALNLALNRISGEFDEDMLSTILKTLDDELLELSGFANDEIAELIETLEPVTEDDYDVEPPKEPKAKLGDVYQLGEHRLMCGDATKIEDVEMLMDGQKADMVFTDPPYGIGYEYNEHEDKQGIEYERFCENWFSVLRIFTDFIFISTGWKYCKFWWNFDPKDCFYWLSRNKRTGGSISHFRKIEPMFIWGIPKNKYDFDFFEQTTEIIEGLRDKHTCPKPVTLISQIIAGVDRGDSVLDVFGGSGTTLIACEQTNRKCYMMELDPKYIDVIIDRWETFTGEEAVKLN